jgi:hypothetical protein
MTHDGSMTEEPISLVDVAEIRCVAAEVVAAFETDVSGSLGGAEIHHIGATALPFGHTKGDVDVNVRVDDAHFAAAVDPCRQGWRSPSLRTGRRPSPASLLMAIRYLSASS